jgi:hypothetical protein
MRKRRRAAEDLKRIKVGLVSAVLAVPLQIINTGCGYKIKNKLVFAFNEEES